ncbi:hypothetical protein [Changpingibacter yushuensis]|uniref:hypothetical protein n=1 Tax=Changpingibacter yushuensis TaxID=2758440 RepID=UPI0015F4D2BF|nr:hypothetical protein [Changpingibacter yushuensis]
MEDIDKDQWAHAQDLLLESSKEKTRIIVLHDNGVIRKIERTDAKTIVNAPSLISDANAQARTLYEANRDGLDFVAIFERHAFDEYFSRMQDSWLADEPLDSFVSRQYKLLDEYPETMVTYPGPAKHQMGLQFRLGVGRNEAIVLINKWVAPNTSVLLGIYDQGALWASIVLSFDETLNISVLTTVDAERVDIVGDMTSVATNAMDWLTSTYSSRATALIWTRDAFERFRHADDKESVVRKSLSDDTAIFLKC